ncbi:MAG: hypothetical protein NT155_02285 [Candidatus Staskawiczbacteria bacterium]|nr:hypothetical protein [Candidatus Staskawiczbacteria bacterium]
MKDICVWFIIASATFFGARYIVKILTGKAVPTTSTWIIFVAGCGSSFLTYLMTENHDIKSGILNTMDAGYVILVLLAIIWRNKGKLELMPLEKKYLAGGAGIVVYGLATGDAWHSNLFAQVLLCLAYAPMYQKILAEKKKTDSYLAWVPATFNALIALYPAICRGNTLSVIYAARAFTLSLIMVLSMRHYELKARKTQAHG